MEKSTESRKSNASLLGLQKYNKQQIHINKLKTNTLSKSPKIAYNGDIKQVSARKLVTKVSL